MSEDWEAMLDDDKAVDLGVEKEDQGHEGEELKVEIKSNLVAADPSIKHVPHLIVFLQTFFYSTQLTNSAEQTR